MIEYQNFIVNTVTNVKIRIYFTFQLNETLLTTRTMLLICSGFDKGS